MVNVIKENLFAAHGMYLKRIETLRKEVADIIEIGLHLGEEYEKEITEALQEIDEELKGVGECIGVVNHLLEYNA